MQHCRKTFPSRYSYKLHSKTHEEEKCYKYDLCPYAFLSAVIWNITCSSIPIRSRTSAKSFRQKQLLKHHCNLYHNPFCFSTTMRKTHQCPECERAFRHKGNFIRHMAVHDPESYLQKKTASSQHWQTGKDSNHRWSTC